MTKKLEELFDLPESNQIDITKEENSVITDIIAEDREVVLPNTPTNTVPEMQSALEKVDKIDAALPSVRQLDTSDKEMEIKLKVSGREKGKAVFLEREAMGISKHIDNKEEFSRTI